MSRSSQKASPSSGQPHGALHQQLRCCQEAGGATGGAPAGKHLCGTARPLGWPDLGGLSDARPGLLT